ncbi:MAG TPA: dTDP-4-dehydrorhamnose 3,5-epimerase [Bacteroidetes bacterium]|nr:dTDP-4-dehydrorhamnose 3,5-epimerase [Bacteroidota bacterium]
MKLTTTFIKDLLIIEPDVFIDERGYFLESFNKKEFEKLTGKSIDFIQDNESKSKYGTLRGLHYQVEPFAQAKLVRVIKGRVLDMAVDIRERSETYGKYFSLELNETNKKQLFIPRGFAHGFVVLSEEAIFTYKCDNYYNKEAEGGIIYNDPHLNIDWKIDPAEIILSEKDKLHPKFGQHKK